jgi:hypothetical protein
MFPETSTILRGTTSQETVNIICTTMTTKKLIHFLIIIIMSSLANSQDRLKLEEQDHGDQHLSCSSPSLQLQNCQLVKKMN